MANGPVHVKACGASRDLFGKKMAKADDERAKRLADALRANLRRRKAQARGDDAPAAEPAVVKPEQDIPPS